jgi:hypothetical protein
MRSRSPPCINPDLYLHTTMQQAIEFIGVIAVISGAILVALTMLLRKGPEEKAEEKPKPRRNPTANWK